MRRYSSFIWNDQISLLMPCLAQKQATARTRTKREQTLAISCVFRVGFGIALGDPLFLLLGQRNLACRRTQQQQAADDRTKHHEQQQPDGPGDADAPEGLRWPACGVAVG